jgi:hypothetical protein
VRQSEHPDSQGLTRLGGQRFGKCIVGLRLQAYKKRIYIDMVQDVIALVSIILTAIVGIVGNTWDKRKKGIRKVTFTGWVAICTAIIAVILGYKQMIDKNNNDSILKERRRLAHSEINKSIQSMIEPFMILAHHKKEINHEDVNYIKNTQLDSLLCNSSPKSNNVSLHQIPNQKIVSRWHRKLKIWEIFNVVFSQTQENTKKLSNEYNSYISENVKYKIDNLFKSKFYVFITDLMPKIAQNSELKDDRTYEFFCGKLQIKDDIDRKKFFEKFDELEKELQIVE